MVIALTALFPLLGLQAQVGGGYGAGDKEEKKPQGYRD
jgi:hypothetical protein